MDNQEKNPNSGKYSMDFGIVEISKLSSETKRMRLPTSVSFDPCEGKIEEKLKKVLEFKTLNKSMIELLRPSVNDRSILTPQKFRMKIRQACEIFFEIMNKNEAKQVYKELFEDLITLLQGEEEKCELLDQYRHMLLMG